MVERSYDDPMINSAELGCRHDGLRTRLGPGRRLWPGSRHAATSQGRGRFGGAWGLRPGEGKRHRKDGSAGRCVPSPNLPVVGLGDPLGDGQPQPTSLTATGAIGSVEAVE
jgi:hypothetical protein